MPALPTLQKDMLVSSDYPMDKVIFLGTGSVTCGALGSGSQAQTITIPHGFDFAPLPLGTWTTDSSWEESYDMDSGPPGPGVNPFAQQVRVSATTSALEVNIINYTASSVTVYVRVYALCPSDKDPLVSETASVSNDFQLSSGFNYTKLLDAGVYDQAAVTGTSSYTVSHGLGYRPQALVWYEVSGRVWPMTTMSPGVTQFAARVSTSLLTFDLADSPAARLHWRIYLDGQT